MKSLSKEEMELLTKDIGKGIVKEISLHLDNGYTIKVNSEILDRLTKANRKGEDDED